VSSLVLPAPFKCRLQTLVALPIPPPTTRPPLPPTSACLPACTFAAPALPLPLPPPTMDFELPGAEDLDALERDALEWPEESLDGHDVSTWRTSRMSGWVADTRALRDSPLMGFYDDPTVDADDDEPPTPDADERILRAMASCPNLRDSVRGCPRRAREAWRSEKAIRSKLAADEATRRHDRDTLRHQVGALGLPRTCTRLTCLRSPTPVRRRSFRHPPCRRRHTPGPCPG
jgi:hypothetical protein